MLPSQGHEGNQLSELVLKIHLYINNFIIKLFIPSVL